MYLWLLLQRAPGLTPNTFGPVSGACRGLLTQCGWLAGWPGLIALPELQRQLWGGRKPHPRRLWAPSPGRRRICGWHCSLGWGGNTAGILKIKGLETVAWPSRPWGGVGARQGQWDADSWGLSTHREQPGQGRLPFPAPLNVLPSQGHFLHAYPKHHPRCLLSAHYVPGLRDHGLRTSCLSFSQPCRSPWRYSLLHLQPQAR